MVKVAGARVVCSCRADKPWKMVGMRMLVVDPRLVTDSHSQALLTPTCDYCHTTTETISSYGHNNPDEPVSDSGNKLLTCSSSSFLVKSWFIDLPHKMQTYDTIKMATCPGTFRLDLVYILGMQFLYSTDKSLDSFLITTRGSFTRPHFSFATIRFLKKGKLLQIR